MATICCVFRQEIPDIDYLIGETENNSDDSNGSEVDDTTNSPDEEVREALSSSVQPEMMLETRKYGFNSLNKRTRSNSDTPEPEIGSLISNLPNFLSRKASESEKQSYNKVKDAVQAQLSQIENNLSKGNIVYLDKEAELQKLNPVSTFNCEQIGINIYDRLTFCSILNRSFIWIQN